MADRRVAEFGCGVEHGPCGSMNSPLLLRVRFLADENLDADIVAAVLRQRPEADMITGRDAGLLGQPDPIVLHYAADHGRILVGNDRKTMPRHFGDFLASGRHTPGILLIAQGTAIGRVAEDLVLIWEASAPDEWVDTITYLPL